MNIRELQRNWDLYGKKDSLWAILTHADKRNGKWDMEEFFRTGEIEINRTMRFLDRLGIEILQGKAMDFGCGVGRLTQALAAFFPQVVGIDIAPSMIEQAIKLNKHGDQCQYVLNEKEDLAQFNSDTFAFIYSNITLQHMEPKYAMNYLKEFTRLLAPGGVLTFQLPYKRNHPQNNWLAKGNWFEKVFSKAPIRLYQGLKGWIFRLKQEPIMEMYGMPPETVNALFNHPNLEMLDVKENKNSGSQWLSYRYTVRKKG